MTARRRANILLGLGAILVALAIAEGVLRAMAPRRTLLYVPDEALLYRLRPGALEAAQPPVHQGGPPVTFRVDSAGFRGPELQAAPARRVVVYGDSFVEARFTPEAATFTGRLQQELAAAGGAPPEVVNAGVTGYGPDQVALRMEGELRALRPELVVVSVFAGNDWGDLVRDQLFGLDGQGRLRRQTARLDRTQRLLVGPAAGLDAFALVRAMRRLRRSAPGDAAAPAEPRTLAWALRECEREYASLDGARPRVTNLFVDHYDADVALRPASTSARYKRALMGGVLARMREEAARAGAPLLLVAVPDSRDLCGDCPHRTQARAYADYRPSLLTDVLDEIARREGMPLLNLYGPFAERGDALYHARDGHWNEEGQALAARLLAARIAEEGWLR